MLTSLEGPLRPAPSKGRPVLRAIVSLAFFVSLVCVGLVFAGGARAQAANTPEGTTEAPVGGAASESGVLQGQTPSAVEPASPSDESIAPTGEQSALATEQTPATSEEAPIETEPTRSPSEQEQSPTTEAPPAAEPAPPVAEVPGPTEQVPVVEDAPPASEQAPPAAEQSPPPAEQAPSPVVEDPAPVEQTPVVEQAPTPAPSQEATEKQAGATGTETSPVGRATEGTGSSQTPTTSGSDHKEATSESSPVATIPGAVSAISATSTVSVEENQAPSTQGTPSAARQARHASREPNVFETSILAPGSVRHLLDMLGGSPASTIALVAIVSPEAIATGALVHGRDAASANHNSSSAPIPAPSPGPAPGGAGGGSAAGGCSGSACSASFILVNALLQAAPNVMLRLYVSQPSWHASFCALILERPD